MRGGYVMKISKKDALLWFEFFSILPEDEERPGPTLTLSSSLVCFYPSKYSKTVATRWRINGVVMTRIAASFGCHYELVLPSSQVEIWKGEIDIESTSRYGSRFTRSVCDHGCLRNVCEVRLPKEFWLQPVTDFRIQDRPSKQWSTH